jgi:uncharacterized protein
LDLRLEGSAENRFTTPESRAVLGPYHSITLVLKHHLHRKRPLNRIELMTSALLRMLFGFGILLTAGCADRLLLHPSTAPSDAHGAERRMIVVQERSVEVWVGRSPGMEKTGEAKVFDLEFCGNATRAEWIAQYVADRWREMAVEVWVMNYPGFGGSQGPAKLDQIGPDALGVFDEMKKVAANRPIVVSGSSLGTAVALYVASNRQVKGMVLQNPPPLQEMLLEKYLWVLPAVVVGQIPEELNSLKSAPQVKAPAIFILAGKDHTVPPKYQQMVVNAYGGEKHIMPMPEADHNTLVKGADDVRLQTELDWLCAKLAE